MESKSRPVKNVTSYLRTLDGSAHPALNSIDSGVVYDKGRSAYVPEAPLEELHVGLESEARLFADALKSYEQEVPEKYKTGVEIAQPLSIHDVVKQIDTSLKSYKDDSHKSVWQAIRKSFWKLGENSDALSSWFDLLPNPNNYCSLIYGGISLILKAAGRVGDVRSEAFRALAEIPIHLENTKEAVGIFKNSENLRKCGVSLYIATLEALGHILKWFKTRAIGKAFGALFKQGTYQNELTDKVKQIEIVSARFKSISIVCLQREVVNNGIIINRAIDQNNNHAITLNSKVDRTNEALVDLMQQNKSQFELNQRNAELNQKTAEALNKMQALLESSFATLPIFRVPKVVDGIESGPPPYKDLVSSSTILGMLRSERELCEEDLAHCLRGVSTMSRPEQDRAVWVMKSEKLRSWMLETSSSTLLLNGNSPTTTARSPMSFVCARLISTLKESKPFIVLHFFCGQHIAYETDENASPLGMMNSLLAQLLMQHSNFEISSQDLASISKNTIDDVLALFAKLVQQLPATSMVFCIVDGISLYQNGERLEDTKVVMDKLCEMIEGEKGAIFKALFASATRTRYLPESLGTEDTLTVPRNVASQTQFVSTKLAGRFESEVANFQGQQID